MLKKMTRNAVFLLALAALFGNLQGCGGSSSSPSAGSGTVAATTGIALPTEVSAISASNSNASASLASQFRSLAAAVADLPAESDYKTTLTAKYVDEPTLEVFGIIETILKATAQTHYGDADNLGAGPYAAMVTWFDDQGGKSSKSLEEWVVQSDMVNDVNQVKVWIDDPNELVKVQVDISTAPTQAADGSYLDYGEWTILADISGSNDGGVFYARAEIVSGQTQLSMSENFTRTENIDGNPVALTDQTRAIMLKSNLSGAGKASIADFDYCWNTGGGASPCTGPSFTLPTIDVQYAYDADTLALDPGDGSAVIYKDRTSPVAINYNYGLFDATTGQNVEKTKQFGFPLVFDSDSSHGYYGAWQGRHQLWSNDGGAPANGTSVTKEVWDGSTAPSYTTRTFNGSLSKRSLVAADLSQVLNIPVEIWMGDGFSLRWDQANSWWQKCYWDPTANGGMGQNSCSATAFDLAAVAWSDNDRKQVNINRWDSTANGGMGANMDYWYDSAASQLKVLDTSNWPPTQTATVYTPTADGEEIWVWISGSTYIEYTGDFTGGVSGWEEKDLTSFDQQTWTPTFAATNLGEFDFPVGTEYYINNKGVNFVVKRTAATNASSDYVVSMEMQAVARPDNVATFLTGVSYLASPWEDVTNRSEFVLETDSASPNYLLLVYATVGTNEVDKNVGDVVTQGKWGLQAYDAGDNEVVVNSNPLQFNWEYADPSDQNAWGAVTYLIDGSSNYLYLDDPITLDPVSLTPLGGGSALNFSLQFDGWMHGLPDMRWELEKSGFVLTDDIRNKVVNIPAATLVSDSASSAQYYIKPLEVGVILPVLSSAPAVAPDPADASSLDLNFTVPTPTDIGAKPTGVTMKYVEGVAVH